MKRSIFLTFFVIFLYSISFSQNISGPIRVSTDFESGSLGRWHLENDTHLVCCPLVDCDQNGRNGVTIWFFGKLDNILHREITIQLKETQEEYNLKMGQSPFSKESVIPMFSYDKVHWQRFSKCSYDLASNTFTIEHIFSQKTAWIAYIEPYTYTRLKKLIKEVEKFPNVKIISIGQSVEGRELYQIIVKSDNHNTDSDPAVWIVARQHPWEVAGSWAVEGLIKYILSDIPDAVSIRNGITFIINPMANPDGVVNGVTRFNAKGIDLNRHWDKSDPYSSDVKNAPETALLKKAMRNRCLQHRLDCWINIHNNDMMMPETGDWMAFAANNRNDNGFLFGKYLKEETVFNGSVSEHKLGSKTTSTTEAVAIEFNTLSMIIEMKVGYLSSVDRWAAYDLHLDYGKGLARAFGRLFKIIE